MNRISFSLRWFLLVGATWLVGCEKETFDVTETEIDYPSPEEIAAVDCPNLMLNVGDACGIGGEAGMVSSECDCINSDSADLISMELINDMATEIVVTVESDPPFLAGPTYVVVPPAGASVSYYLPEGTTAFSLAAYFPCFDIGVAEVVELYSNASSVAGVTVELHVDCP
ncbi:hypothetical protein N9I61_00765 [Flavobacteriales bacterium]|jgi:hypothetical protein|nr:hypothetical protein [Flavobacteriales bacterium]